MATKRPHTKTRHGCKKCRERRVRCDLQRPRCGNCIKRRVECPYLEDVVPEAVNGPQIVPSPSLAPGYPVNTDLHLMHHYTTSTCFTISEDASKYHVWQDVVPSLAFESEYLLHELLALAALHKCRDPMLPITERATLAGLGRHHKHLALAPYIPLLKHSSSANCQPLFAFSVLLGSLCFAMISHDEEDGYADNILDSLYHISTLLTGAVAIAYKHRDDLHASELSPLLGMDLQPCNADDLPDGIRQSLQAIRDATHQGLPDLPSIDKETCLLSMRWLGLLHKPQADGSVSAPSHAAMTAWPIMSGRKFMELVSARDTLALIVLAHYGAIMHMHRHIWFLDGLGGKIVAAVTKEVGLGALKYLDWTGRVAATVTPS